MIHSHTCFQGLCAVLAGTALSHADEPAVSISDFGVDKVMSGPVVSINDQYKGVVKIEMDSLTPDYATPWNTGRYQGGIGTGFLIGENAFMTNAHVVSNAERIYISMYGDSRKIPARVKFIAHDADLALLEADDPRPFKGIRPFEFSKNLPHLEDEVRVIGYPIGGNRLSVTRGVVSRIDFTTYAHPRNTEHLTIQVDAAINPGNSGGALALAVADRVLMLENAVYAILSPEGFASILWKDAQRSGEAAELMKLTAPELKKLGVIDGIVREPEGGAQTDPSRTLWNLDRALTACLEPLLKESAVSLTERRYQKFRALGRGKEDA